MRTTVARVRVTLEIETGDSWGDDCTLSQVRRQASAAAIQTLRHGVSICGLKATRHGEPREAVVVGDPVVTAILVVDERASAAEVREARPVVDDRETYLAAEQLVARYQACAEAIWKLFDSPPNTPSHFWIDRLEALLRNGLLLANHAR
jgi:hypothetical protein